jgi:hypothetical protein
VSLCSLSGFAALAALAQPAPAPDSAPRPGYDLRQPIPAEAPIVGGNAASARQRALDDAFRQAVERVFAVLIAEAGISSAQPPPPALMQLKSTFFSRPKRYIRGYSILEEHQDAGRMRLMVDADVNEGQLRREIDKARGAAPVALPASAPSVLVAGGSPEAVLAMARALNGAGVKADAPALGTLDDAGVRDIAARNHLAAGLVVNATVTEDGPVRGTGKWAAGCRMAARVLPVGGAPPVDRGAEARAFSDGKDAARAECLARSAGDVARQMAAGFSGAVPPRDARAVSLDLDLVEPAVLPMVLQALKKMGNVSSAEVRRVTVGHVEIRAVTRLTGPALVSAIARELGAAAEVTPGQAAADRAVLQVRLPPAAPPPAPPTPTTP